MGYGRRGRAAPGGTSRCVHMAGRCGAAGAITSRIRRWDNRCAGSATTTSATCCGSGTHPSCGRRFTIALQRRLAAQVGLSVRAFRERCRISYSKVVEFQTRGLIHVHVPIRLDGADGPDGPATDLPLTTSMLEDGIRAVTAAVRLHTEPLRDGAVYELRWGSQVHCRSITLDAGRDSARNSRVAHPEQVAAYLAKYLTKTTEDFGLPGRVRSAIHARSVGASPHAVRIIETAMRISGQGESYVRLRDNLATLGYRGHPSPSHGPTRSLSARSAALGARSGETPGSIRTRTCAGSSTTTPTCPRASSWSPRGSTSDAGTSISTTPPPRSCPPRYPVPAENASTTTPRPPDSRLMPGHPG